MKTTITDELLSCIVQLNVDIEEMRDILEYIEPIHERLKALTKNLVTEG